MLEGTTYVMLRHRTYVCDSRAATACVQVLHKEMHMTSFIHHAPLIITAALILGLVPSVGIAQYADSAASGLIVPATHASASQATTAQDTYMLADASVSSGAVQARQAGKGWLIAGLAAGTVAGLVVAGKPEICRRYDRNSVIGVTWEGLCTGTKVMRHVSIVLSGSFVGGLVGSVLQRTTQSGNVSTQ